jgi:hypothetical protein
MGGSVVITLKIEASFEDYIWEDFCDNNKVDPEDFTDEDLVEFVDTELGFFADSVVML